MSDFSALSEKLIAEAIPNADMAAHTSFRAGGRAELLVLPKNAEELKQALAVLKTARIPVFVMGCGSNLLVRDGGWEGAIIKLDGLYGLTLENGVVTAECGVKLSALARFCIDNSLAGLEFAGGIPGSVGGGVYMNAGAYGGELKDCIIGAIALDGELRELSLSPAEMALGYRTSAFQANDLIILSASFKPKPGDKQKSDELLRELNRRRREKQPLEYPSAGSTFKRPTGYYAGTLIQECGLKGAQIGGARVSEKHAGFIINAGGATAADIEALIKHVQSIVYEKAGVRLETEVRIIGRSQTDSGLSHTYRI